MNHRMVGWITAACCAGFVAAASGQTSTATQGGRTSTANAAPARDAAGTANAPAADQRFMKEAAKGGMAEVELGKLAEEKASNAKVKDFGRRMAEDHGKANDELKSIAMTKHVTLDTSMDAMHKAEQNKLSRLSGDAFDRAYINSMVQDHKKDVATFRREAKSAKDPDVRAFAEKALPTLEDHLKTVMDIQKEVSGAAASRATSGTSSTGTNKSGTSGTGTNNTTKSKGAS